MRVSQQILEWQAEAIVKERRAVLLRVLEKLCKAPVPNDLVTTIQATEDMALLENWFDAAVDVSTFDDFRASIRR